jgi:hypothetical protein
MEINELILVYKQLKAGIPVPLKIIKAYKTNN